MTKPIIDLSEQCARFGHSWQGSNVSPHLYCEVCGEWSNSFQFAGNTMDLDVFFFTKDALDGLDDDPFIVFRVGDFPVSVMLGPGGQGEILTNHQLHELKQKEYLQHHWGTLRYEADEAVIRVKLGEEVKEYRAHGQEPSGLTLIALGLCNCMKNHEQETSVQIVINAIEKLRSINSESK